MVGSMHGVLESRGFKDEVEVVMVVSARDIASNKLRTDIGITYEQEVLRLLARAGLDYEPRSQASLT